MEMVEAEVLKLEKTILISVGEKETTEFFKSKRQNVMTLKHSCIFLANLLVQQG